MATGKEKELQLKALLNVTEYANKVAINKPNDVIRRRKEILDYYFWYLSAEMSSSGNKDGLLNQKHEIVSRLREPLENNKLTPDQQLKEYDRIFTPQNRAILGKRRDRFEMTLLKALTAIVLTPVFGAGLYLGHRFFVSNKRSVGAGVAAELETAGMEPPAKKQKVRQMCTY